MMGSSSIHSSQLVLKAFSESSIFGPLKLVIGVVNWIAGFLEWAACVALYGSNAYQRVVMI